MVTREDVDKARVHYYDASDAAAGKARHAAAKATAAAHADAAAEAALAKYTKLKEEYEANARN